MTDSIKTLAWIQIQGTLHASTGTGTLNIKFQDRQDYAKPGWQLTFTPFPEPLGEHASLEAAMQAAKDFVGDSE
jgi:hypothetical protein